MRFLVIGGGGLLGGALRARLEAEGNHVAITARRGGGAIPLDLSDDLSGWVERRIHDAFSDTRTSKSREFFEIAPERVMSAIKLVEIRDVTPSEDYIENKEDGAALLRAKKRAPFAGFSSVGIPIKSILSFSKDETETCVVFSEKTVMYKDEELSLSAAGGKVLCSKFGWSQESGVNGLLFWMYEGENIFNRRIRLEEENA